MRAHVLVLPQRGDSLLAAWMYYSGRPAHSTSGHGRWEEFCQAEVRRAVAGDAAESAVFICLLGDGLAANPDQHLLERILADVKRFGWGPQVYLVTTRRQPDERTLADHRPGLASFFAAALTNRVQCLLQVGYKPTSAEAEDPAFFKEPELWKAANRFRDWALLHRADLMPTPSRRPWRCLFPEETVALQQDEGPALLLDDLVHPWQERSPSNLVVLVDKEIAGDEQIRVVERARKHFGGRQLAVAMLGVAASSVLRGYCRAHDLGSPLALEGTLELWYLLLRLNHRPATIRQAAAGSHRVEAVSFAGSPSSARPPATLGMPSLLISSSFDPAESSHCEAAAEDAGKLLQLAPLALPYRVSRTLDPQRLAEILGEEQAPRIWVHGGHGDGRHGLQASPFGQMVGVDEWLACLRVRNVPLDLIVLLTCDSAEIARRFAAAGVAVSVGFRGDVPTAAAGRLAEEILRQVFTNGLTAAAVVEGFARGVDRIGRVGGRSGAEPWAFYST